MMFDQNRKDVLVIIESARESGRQLISGLADYSREHGHWDVHWAPVGFSGLSDLVNERSFDGVLARNINDAEVFHEQGIPLVVFAHMTEFKSGQASECADNSRVCETVAHHFIGRGFENFAFFGQRNANWASSRAKFFEEQLRSAGFDLNIFMADCSSPEQMEDAENIESVCRWLTSLPKPIALMAANDDAGRWVIQLCRRAGVKVPDQCAIVGVDNDPVVCGLSNPPLSSVVLDQHRAGYEAAALLDKMMNGESPKVRQIIGQVVGLEIRQSSDIFAVEDPALAKALQFIHANANRRVSVEEVSQISGLNRRTLQRNFKSALSRSVQHYMRTVRSDYIAKQLRETRLPLEELTELCGFSESSHLSRFFSADRGESPSVYRKRHRRS